MNKTVSKPPASTSFRKWIIVDFLPNWLLAQTAEQTKTSTLLVVVSHPASDIILTRQLNSRAHMWKWGIFYKFCTFAVIPLLLLHNTLPSIHGLGHMEDHIEPKSVHGSAPKNNSLLFGLLYDVFFHQMLLIFVTRFLRYPANTHRQTRLKT